MWFFLVKAKQFVCLDKSQTNRVKENYYTSYVLTNGFIRIWTRNFTCVLGRSSFSTTELDFGVQIMISMSEDDWWKTFWVVHLILWSNDRKSNGENRVGWYAVLRMGYTIVFWKFFMFAFFLPPPFILSSFPILLLLLLIWLWFFGASKINSLYCCRWRSIYSVLLRAFERTTFGSVRFGWVRFIRYFD